MRKAMINLWKIVHIIAATGLFAASTSAAAADYSASKVLAQMGVHNTALKIITSHRGQYSSYCPENSICAVKAAAAAGIESVEIDVKESKDSTLWPFHDANVGRTTDYTYNGPLYDPFRNSINNFGTNPLVISLTDHQLYQLHLRDDLGKVSQYHATDLKTLLTVIRGQVPNIAVILDLKTPSSVITASKLITQLQMQDQVLLKFSINNFMPQNLGFVANGVRFAITIYQGDLDKIYGMNPLGSPSVVVADYITQYRARPGFTYLELGAKDFDKVNGRWGIKGSMGEIAYILRNRNIALGAFAPQPEKFADFRSELSGYYRTDGSCCAQLSDYYTKTKYFGNETTDDRINIDAEVNIFDNVLTDGAPEAVQRSYLIGGRVETWRILR